MPQLLCVNDYLVLVKCNINRMIPPQKMSNLMIDSTWSTWTFCIEDTIGIFLWKWIDFSGFCCPFVNNVFCAFEWKAIIAEKCSYANMSDLEMVNVHNVRCIYDVGHTLAIARGQAINIDRETYQQQQQQQNCEWMFCSCANTKTMPPNIPWTKKTNRWWWFEARLSSTHPRQNAVV